MSDLQYAVLPAGAWIEVKGDDAAHFLQSQFSADLRERGPIAVPGLWLDHRGLIHGAGTVLRTGESEFLIHSEWNAEEEITRKLESHIIADDVELAPGSGGFVQLVFWDGSPGGSASRELLGCELPAGRWIELNGIRIFNGIQFSDTFIICVGSNRSMDTLLRSMEDSGAERISTEGYLYRRIYDGVAPVPRVVGPGDSPIEAGLARFCSTDKGCYLGQEVFARQLRLDRTTRELRRLGLGEGILPVLPSPVLFEGEVVGELRVVAEWGGRRVGMGFLKKRFSDVGRCEAGEGQLSVEWLDRVGS